MIYQICKEIGAYATVLEGDIDSIILTGGIAYSKKIVEKIKNKVKFIAPVIAYPGEDEMIALAQGGLRVLNGEEKALDYEKEVLWHKLLFPYKFDKSWPHRLVQLFYILFQSLLLHL